METQQPNEVEKTDLDLNFTDKVDFDTKSTTADMIDIRI